jgi:hypothetical protein
MTELAKDVAAIDVTDLLARYSFDLGGAVLDRLVESWLNRYPVRWVRLAVIEALYQGRYKAISVEQILNLWQRRGKSLYRFNHEFERVICGRFPSTPPASHRYASHRYASYPPIGLSSSAPPVRATPDSTQSNPCPRRDAQPTNAQPPDAQPIEPTQPQPETGSPPAKMPSAAAQSEPIKPTPFVAAWSASSVESIAELTSRPESKLSEVQPPEVQPPEVQPPPDPELTASDLADPESAERLEPTASALPDESPVSPFSSDATLDTLDQASWVAYGTSRSAIQRQPIHQFIPSPESSDFYAKLRAVAQGLASVESVESDSHR